MFFQNKHLHIKITQELEIKTSDQTKNTTFISHAKSYYMRHN